MTRLRTAFLALAILAVATPALAEPPQKSIFNFRGLTGQASWSDFDGCLLTSVQLVANQNVSQSPGEPPGETDQLTLSYVVVDFCTGEFRFGSGSGPAFVEGSLRGLTIEGTIPILESSNTGTVETTATVIVTLSPTGEVTRGEQNFNLTTPTTVVQVRSIGASTSADPSGVVVVDGVDLIDGVGGTTGTISQTNAGTVTIFH
jgi:hypothetical protein